MESNLWVALIAGLASFLSPCVLPLIPAYIGYMGGRATHTAAAQTANPSQPTALQRFNIFLHGLAFVGGFTLIFVGIGLLSTAFVRQIGGDSIALVRDVLTRAGGLLIIFFGLHFTGLLHRAFAALLARPALLRQPLLTLGFALGASVLIAWAFVDILIILPLLAAFWLWLFLSGGLTQPEPFWTGTIRRLQTLLYADTRRQLTAQGKQSYASSAVMGLVFAAGWTPCIGPIYGSILTMAATGADVSQAGSLMIAYSLGLGIPFLLAALLLDQATTILRRLSRHVRRIEMAAGVLLVVIGVLVASGQMTLLSQSLNGQFQAFSYRVEECAAEVSTGARPLGEFFACINAPEMAETAQTL
ncbi:MAG: cytochrome c biogenesis protein CcdA [bacterium]|nr:cytochrome c biogenesis protein CcdA [bacterium]